MASFLGPRGVRRLDGRTDDLVAAKWRFVAADDAHPDALSLDHLLGMARRSMSSGVCLACGAEVGDLDAGRPRPGVRDVRSLDGLDRSRDSCFEVAP